MSKQRTAIFIALSVLTVVIFLVTHPAWVATTYADWKDLTFHEPAHYLFEFQNEAIVFIIGYIVHLRKLKAAEERAVREHDAAYHPRHAHAVNDDGTIKEDAA